MSEESLQIEAKFMLDLFNLPQIRQQKSLCIPVWRRGLHILRSLRLFQWNNHNDRETLQNTE